MENKLDRLIQEISKKKRSQVSFKPAECGHHIIRRQNKLTRWDLDNIVYLTIEEHTLVHSKPSYEDKILSDKQKEYRDNHRFSSVCDYLWEKNISQEEFLLSKYNTLMKLIEG